VKENFAEVEGLRIRYLEEGEGPAVLLLHGASLGSSADVWAGNFSDLAARGLRVIACDLPGFGLSDNPEDSSVAYRTRFVPAFMDALRLEKSRLIGHSQSGRIAVSLALEHGERVPGVVVLGTGSLLPLPPGGGKSDAAEGEEGARNLRSKKRRLPRRPLHQNPITRAALEMRHRMSTGKNFQAFLERARARRATGRSRSRNRSCRGALPRCRCRCGGSTGEDRGHAAERASSPESSTPPDLHLAGRCKHLVQGAA
jgi:pimeloyl-ACP methyl ester carboxylesterase